MATKKTATSPKKTAPKAVKYEVALQPAINIGLVGHVDHGKTTITERLSGKWTDTHSEEVKRGITIRLGYANTTFYKCPKCSGAEAYGTHPKCGKCGGDAVPLRKVSLVDAPGHETLMATMMSGSAIMDCALLLVAANEECPQPQTKEHLMALTIAGLKNIIIIQNKIDLVSEEQAMKNFNQIKAFVKGTIAEKAPIIPISAQLGINIDVLIQAIEENFPTPERGLNADPIMLIARSFDVNRPGSDIKKLHGGVLGGALIQGKLKIGDELEIRPGRKVEREGKTFWEPIKSAIVSLMTGTDAIEEAIPGGSIAVMTELDPSLVKSDSLAGNIVGHAAKLPPVWNEFDLKPHLLERAVGTENELAIEPIKKGEPLMLNVNASVTTGIVSSISKDSFHINLKRPVCAQKTDKLPISRMIGHRFRLIGYATIKN